MSRAFRKYSHSVAKQTPLSLAMYHKKNLHFSSLCWLFLVEWLFLGQSLFFTKLSLVSFRYHFRNSAATANWLQSCPTLYNPIGGSPPGSPIPGILQARTLEWVAISFSNAWKWKMKVKSLSRVQPSATPWTAAFQAPPSMGFSRQEYWSGVPLPSPLESINTYYWSSYWKMTYVASEAWLPQRKAQTEFKIQKTKGGWLTRFLVYLRKINIFIHIAFQSVLSYVVLNPCRNVGLIVRLIGEWIKTMGCMVEWFTNNHFNQK